MGIGAGILLIVIGAILTFAVDATITGIDLKVGVLCSAQKQPSNTLDAVGRNEPLPAVTG